MSYTLSKTGAQIDNILDRADTGGAIDQSIALKAPLSSPAFTGTPTAPTPAEGDDSTQVATTEFVNSAIGDVEDGSYPGMSVGASDNLISDAKISNSSPYLYRPVLNGVGNRAYSKLIGATIANNQLSVNTDVRTLTNWTATSGNQMLAQDRIAGHVYYVKDVVTEFSGETSYRFYYDGTAHSRTGASGDVVYRASTSGNGSGGIANVNFASGVVGTVIAKMVFVPQIFDLTAMFGSAIADYVFTLETQTAGSGIAWLKSYGFFGKYAPYNAGSLISTKATGKKVVGRNLLNPATVSNGYRIDANGQLFAESGFFTSDWIKVEPSSTYRKNYAIETSAPIALYDGDKNFISRITSGSYVTTTANTGYIRVTFRNASVSAQVEKGTTATAYTPYTSQEYDLGSDELRGLFKLDNGNLYADGDIKTSDGTITRKYGIVDLGTLTWTAYSAETGRFRAIKSDVKTGISQAICSKYLNVMTFSDWENIDNSIAVSTTWSSGFAIFIHDSNLANKTGAEVKAAMNGVYLVYELATPTTETGTPFIDPSIVYPNGTEEYIDTRTVPVPMGNITEYTEDLKGGLETILDTPSANGTYVLKATVSGGVATLSWVSE